MGDQKLNAEIRSAARERDIYLKSVDKAHALEAMETPKAMKESKIEDEGAESVARVSKRKKEENGEENVSKRRVVRSFRQVKEHAESDDRAKLPRSLLASVFGAKTDHPEK